MLDAKVNYLRARLPDTPGHRYVLTAGSPTYGRPWTLASVSKTHGGHSNVVTLGWSAREAGITLDAMLATLDVIAPTTN